MVATMYPVGTYALSMPTYVYVAPPAGTRPALRQAHDRRGALMQNLGRPCFLRYWCPKRKCPAVHSGNDK